MGLISKSSVRLNQLPNTSTFVFGPMTRVPSRPLAAALESVISPRHPTASLRVSECPLYAACITQTSAPTRSSKRGWSATSSTSVASTLSTVSTDALCRIGLIIESLR
eukprot:scaffold25100_cov68-Phaeocystis_antarctica.AAC.16